ncbi:hypothetical protein ACFFMR_26025 [Micromonospora andamanensis]|uniref:Uncharacterized protein n=1 Tax=Micromonospora andamanensis TaxID=1287068 RepID=A0ABQ4I570_9ACTN|nr:hypothetical protein [Micromonospora andamanensis]GIJ13028.1 hypothetical protein Van01_62420 [Micromonospora andamanensis]
MLCSTAPARHVAAALGSVLLAGCHAVPAVPANAPPSSTLGGQQPAATAATAPGLTPQQRLTTIAAGIGPVPADSTTDLSYEYLHLQRWTRTSGAIRREDLRRWRHPDGSGREVTRRAPDVPGVDHQPTSEDRTLFTQAPPTTTRYRGDLHPYLPAPLPTVPAALAGLLAPPELAAEPAYPRILTWGVVGLAASQYLDQNERATTLHVLAAVPGIEYRGQTTDLAGRAGLGFRVVADRSTTMLVIDPATGELLAAQECIAGPRPGLFSSVLILQRGHSDADGVPPEPATALR